MREFLFVSSHFSGAAGSGSVVDPKKGPKSHGSCVCTTGCRDREGSGVLPRVKYDIWSK